MGGETPGFPPKPERHKDLLNLMEESFPLPPIANLTPHRMRAFRVVHCHGPYGYGKRPERDAPERGTHLRETFFCNLPQEPERNVDKGRFNDCQARRTVAELLLRFLQPVLNFIRKFERNKYPYHYGTIILFTY